MISGGIPAEFTPFGRKILEVYPKDNQDDSGHSVTSTFSCPETEISRDLFRGGDFLPKAFKAVTISGDSQEIGRWRIRLSQAVNQDDKESQSNHPVEEELFFSNKCVIWSKSDAEGNQCLLKTFSFPTAIKDAVWCSFSRDESEEKIEDFICINNEVNLEFFSKTGDHFPVSLPFQVSKMIPSNKGLLIEREASKTPKASEVLPALFSLSHPLKDVTPVVLKWPLGGIKSMGNTFLDNTSMSSTSFLTPENKYQLVTNCIEYNLCILFNRADGTHSVWLLREAFEDEVNAGEANHVRRLFSLTESPLVSNSNGVNTRSSTNSCNSPFGKDVTGSGSKTGTSNVPRQSSSVSSPSLTRYALTQSMSHASPSGSLSSSLKTSRLTGSSVPGGSPFIRSFGSPTVTSSPNAFQSPSLDNKKKKQTNDSPYASFYRAVNSTPRTMEYSLGEEMVQPILPEQCLEHLWSETASTATSSLSMTPRFGMIAKKVFATTDLVGQTYLLFHIQCLNTVKLVKFDSSNRGGQLIFGNTTSISNVKDVEPVPKNNMFIVLESSSSSPSIGLLSPCITLYSGVHRVSVVYLPTVGVSKSIFPASDVPGRSSVLFKSSEYAARSSLLIPNTPAAGRVSFNMDVDGPGLSPVQGMTETVDDLFDVSSTHIQLSNITCLRDGVSDRITTRDGDGNCFRVTLPPMTSSSVVSLCLTSMKVVLPKDISMQVMSRWYSVRNASSVSADLTEEKEIMLFKKCLLSLIGYEVEDLANVSAISSVTTTQTVRAVTPAGKTLLSTPSTPTFEVNKRPRIEMDTQGTDDDWKWFEDFLEKKEGKIDNQSSNCLLDNNILTPSPSCVLFPFLPHLLYSLHLTYEEMKLHPLMWSLVPQLLDLLFLFASDLKKVLYQDHYLRDFPDVCLRMNCESRIPEEDVQLVSSPSFFTESPPSIYSCLQTLLKTNNYSTLQVCPFPYIPSSCTRIRMFVLLFASLKHESFSEKEFLHSIQIHGKSVSHEDFFSGLRKSKGFAERLVLAMDRLGITKNDLMSFPHAISLLLRDGIQVCENAESCDWPSSVSKLFEKQNLLIMKEKSVETKRISKRIESEVEEDGLLSLNRDVLKKLFPEDQRVNEAYQMLQSSKPVKISIAQRPGVNDHDFIEEQERHLYTICIRTMALSVGRGMFTLRTYKPVIAETFPVPKLCLSGRVPPRNTAVELSHIDVPVNMTTWPSFHNGVAAGLRACVSASDVIDSSWIIYNRPKSSGGSETALNEHAGFLLALGLNGHLSKLSSMHIHEYLCRGNELTRVAVLLGLAAARRGTQDAEATKVLSIHIEALLPPTSTELDVPPVVQVAAVLGIGLLYQGSGNGHIAEVLLNEIGRPPGPEMEHYIDRESYALAAGLAFGLVTLGKGNALLTSSSEVPVTTSISATPTSECISMADQLCNFMIGGYKKPLSIVQKEKYKTPSYQIREGDYINADVTSPGATLALGMMFFDTNNEAVSRWVTAPDTQQLLETVRPDFLMLRTLSKGLIMWSSIQPLKTWVDSHVPPVVTEYAFRRHEDYNPRIDYETMSQAYCNIIAGACMALGLKFAGSGDKDAFKAVMGYTKMFIQLPNTSRVADQAGRSTIESCLNVLVISLSLIMAGTGDLEVMKICRYLRARTSQVNVVLYGSHMATHMALGFLFLGGCRYSISTSKESVAALICALFPKFPIHSHDNRYHLQAFRHLYVLAVEPKQVIVKDNDSGEGMHLQLPKKKNVYDMLMDKDNVLSLDLSSDTSMTFWQMKLAVSASLYCPSLKSSFVEKLKNIMDVKVREANYKEVAKYLRGQMDVCEATKSTTQVLLLCDLPPYASLSPLQDKSWSFPDLASNLKHFNLSMTSLMLFFEALKQDNH